MLTPDELTIDPEFRSLLPPQSDSEVATLRESIATDGFAEPLIVWRSKLILLDGHTRYDIWSATFRDNPDRQPDIKEMDFSCRSAAKCWVLKNQMGRRNITAAQRVEIALMLKDEIAAQARGRMSLGRGRKQIDQKERGRTVDVIAKLANTSPDTVQKVEFVLASSADQVKQEMRSGERSIHSAWKEVSRPTVHGVTEVALRELPFDESRMMRLIDQIKRTAEVLDDSGKDRFTNDLWRFLQSWKRHC